MKAIAQLYTRDNCSWYKGYGILLGLFDNISRTNYYFNSTMGLTRYSKNVSFYTWGTRETLHKKFDGIAYSNEYYL